MAEPAEEQLNVDYYTDAIGKKTCKCHANTSYEQYGSDKYYCFKTLPPVKINENNWTSYQHMFEWTDSNVTSLSSEPYCCSCLQVKPIEELHRVYGVHSWSHLVCSQTCLNTLVLHGDNSYSLSYLQPLKEHYFRHKIKWFLNSLFGMNAFDAVGLDGVEIMYYVIKSKYETNWD